MSTYNSHWIQMNRFQNGKCTNLLFIRCYEKWSEVSFTLPFFQNTILCDIFVMNSAAGKLPFYNLAHSKVEPIFG